MANLYRRGKTWWTRATRQGREFRRSLKTKIEQLLNAVSTNGSKNSKPSPGATSPGGRGKKRPPNSSRSTFPRLSVVHSSDMP
jgi:hypothetical protein